MDVLVIAPPFSHRPSRAAPRATSPSCMGFFFGRCARRRYHDAIAATSGDLCLRFR